jgi:hypothetical protein
MTSVTPHQPSAVVADDPVVGYRGYRDIGVSPSLSRECRRPGRAELRRLRGADIRRGNAAQALHFADALRLEYGSRRIVHYLGGSYSTTGQKRPEDRGDQQFAHLLFPIRFSCFEVRRPRFYIWRTA